jgi:hypothetical protein
LNIAASDITDRDTAHFWRGKLAHINLPSRSERYRMRVEGEGATSFQPVSFAELAAIPAWINWPDEEQRTLAIVAAILAHADAIERELSGEKLRSLAITLRDDLFDYIAEHHFESALQLNHMRDVAEKLPRPEDLEQMGRRLLLSSLPLVLQKQYPEAAGDMYGRQITDLARTAISAFQSHISAEAEESVA